MRVLISLTAPLYCPVGSAVVMVVALVRTSAVLLHTAGRRHWCIDQKLIGEGRWGMAGFGTL